MTIEQQILEWRAHVSQRGAISAHDVEEMESHLRDQVHDLLAVGLAEDEAFLVAVKRIGNLDAVSHEFAQEHTERLWKQLVLPERPAPQGEIRLVVWLAVAAAVAARLAVAWLDSEQLVRNAALLALPFPTAYFVWRHRPPRLVVAVVVGVYAAAAVLLNVFPFGDQTGYLQAVHAPMVLWLAGLGVAYAGGRWRSDRRRMDLIRFTGEWVIYYALLALGGGLLMGLCGAAFTAAGVPVDFLPTWVLPGGAAGAVVVAAWLVEAKQGVVENMAPVLTRVFTPLTLVMLLAVLGAFVAGRGALHVDRDLLVVMDLILVLVLGLLLYALSARSPDASAGLFDWLQLALVVVALLVDAVVAYAMVARIAEFGWSANKATALGLNVVLLANLVPSAWLSFSFVRGRRTVGALERWQTAYLPVYAVWAALVVVAVPPVFGFQ